MSLESEILVDEVEEESMEWSNYDIYEFKDTQMISLYGRWQYKDQESTQLLNGIGYRSQENQFYGVEMYLYDSDYVNDFIYLKMGDFGTSDHAQILNGEDSTLTSIAYSQQTFEMLAP